MSARREWRYVAIALIGLAAGALIAEPYARLASPGYTVVARMIAAGHPWRIDAIGVARSDSGPGAILRLTGTVGVRRDDPAPSAWLVSKLQVAAVAECAVIFWTVLCAWPAASIRQRLAYLALGIPVFVGLEAATTVCELLNPLAYASAVLAGDANPVTGWERWTRFLEAGGRVALALIAALATIVIAQRAGRARANDR